MSGAPFEVRMQSLENLIEGTLENVIDGWGYKGRREE